MCNFVSRYAAQEERKRRLANMMVVAAWIMALAISLPMHIDTPGFSNLNNLTELIIENNSLGGCMPPVGILQM